jgi:hypothetical protein
MISFWIAWLIAVTSVAEVPLIALDQVGTDSGGRPATKPPVGDFDPPRSKQIQIIDDGPVVHDYRSAPQAPVTQESWKNAAYEDLWKSTCETSPEIQCVSRLFIKEPDKTNMTKWLADLGRATSPLDHRLRPIPDFASFPQLYQTNPMKKGLLNQSECMAIYQMVLNLREKLDQAYEQYLSTDEQASKLARPALVEMAGLVAIERLDRAIATSPRPQDIVPPGNTVPAAPELQ